MPLGPYEDFGQCVQAHKLMGHDDESARRICGEMQQRIEGSVKTNSATTATASRSSSTSANAVTTIDRNRDKVFLKVFLIDSSVNKNHWGVTPDSIPKNIYSAIGKPVVLYKNTGKEPDASHRVVGEYDHPFLGGADSVEHAYAYQDLFRVATYIDVFESSDKPGQWFGIAEVTDEGVKRALREDPDLPMYVSPTIRLLSVGNESENNLTQWSFMHSAIVDKPAFGIDKAYIGGQCSGQKNTCLLQLRKAAIVDNNHEVGCGFCTYKATKDIQVRLRQASSSLSSLEKFGEKLQNRKSLTMSENNSNQNNDPNNNNTTTTTTKDQNLSNQQNQPEEAGGGAAAGTNTQSQQEQQTVEKNQSKTTVTKNNNNNNNTNDNNKQVSTSELLETVQRLAAENKNLQMQLQTAKADVDTHKQINSQFETRLASLEKEREHERATIRTEQITNYVNAAPAYRALSAQDREKQIESFVKGSMTIEEIRNIIEPLNASLAKQYQYPNRSASMRGGPTRLSLGANTGKTIEVRSAAATDKNESPHEEELPFYLELPQSMGLAGGGSS